MSIQAVFFDLGRVLADFDWSRAVARLRGISPLNDIALTEFLVRSKATLQYETGRLQSVEFFSQLSKSVGVSDLGLLQEAWCDIFTPVSENIRLPGMLSKRHFVGLISNTCPAHIEWLRTRFDLLNDFHRTVYSFEVGRLKPDIAIYQAAIEGHSWIGSEILFIDDLVENVEGASRLGWQTIHYRKGDNLEERLSELGVKI